MFLSDIFFLDSMNESQIPGPPSFQITIYKMKTALPWPLTAGYSWYGSAEVGCGRRWQCCVSWNNHTAYYNVCLRDYNLEKIRMKHCCPREMIMKCWCPDVKVRLVPLVLWNVPHPELRQCRMALPYLHARSPWDTWVIVSDKMW